MLLNLLKDDGAALSHADTHRTQRMARCFKLLQFLNRGHDQAGAAHPQRMPQCNCPPLAIDARGIILHPGCTITGVTGDDNAKDVALSDGTTISADTLMVATGRKPMTDGLGLEAVGIETDQSGAIPVDENSMTPVPSIYAIGDVTNRINLTPVAIAEGHVFADTIYGGMARLMDHRNVPSAVFSQPPIGSVGLTEEQARQDGFDPVIYASSFRAMKNTISGREEKTVMKLVVDQSSNKVIGAHMLGPDAPEIMQGLAIAIKAGATKADFDATMLS